MANTFNKAYLDLPLSSLEERRAATVALTEIPRFIAEPPKGSSIETALLTTLPLPRLPMPGDMLANTIIRSHVTDGTVLSYYDTTATTSTRKSLGFRDGKVVFYDRISEPIADAPALALPRLYLEGDFGVRRLKESAVALHFLAGALFTELVLHPN